MDLEKWLRKNNIRPKELAKKLNTAKTTVHFWMRGKHMPSKRCLVALEQFTEGKVTKRDFKIAVEKWKNNLKEQGEE